MVKINKVLEEASMKNGIRKLLMVFVMGILVSATQTTVFCADIIVNSYTKAGLPAAGTAGRLARVTDDVRGVWKDTGTVWIKLLPYVDVEDFTEGGSTVQAAIDAANASTSYKEVRFASKTYPLTGALNLANKSYLKLTGSGMRSTILSFGNVTGHGLDMTGADHFDVSDMAISAVGGTPKAGILLARISGGAAGGHSKFRRLQVVGWESAIYSYGSELNSYEHVSAFGKVGLFSNASNPLGYTSSFVTIAAGGQSNSYLSWFHGQLESTAALDATYDAAVVLDGVQSVHFYNPIVMARGANLGSNVQLRTTAKNVGFYGVRLEVVGAIGFKIDSMSVNRMEIHNVDVAPEYPTTFKLVGKGTSGSVSGLVILGNGMVAGNVATVVDLDILVGAIIDATNAKIVVATRFGGIVTEGDPTTWTLPTDRQGIVITSQGRTWLLNRVTIGGPGLATLGTLENIKSLSGAGDNVRGENLRGQATLNTDTGSLVVTFPTAEPSASYYIQLTGDGNQTLWVTNKTATGFTINRSATTGARIVDWFLIR